MNSLTRWVLAHKRIVVIAWVLLTIAGMAAAGPASEALDQKFSVPDKEGWETNQTIAEHYRGHRRRQRAARPGRHPARRQDGRLAGRPLRARQGRRRLAKALPGSRIASYASTGDRDFVSTTGARPSRSSTRRRTRTRRSARTPSAEKAARAALQGATVGGAPVHLTGFDALQDDRRATTARACCSRRCSAASAP